MTTLSPEMRTIKFDKEGCLPEEIRDIFPECPEDGDESEDEEEESDTTGFN